MGSTMPTTRLTKLSRVWQSGEKPSALLGCALIAVRLSFALTKKKAGVSSRKNSRATQLSLLGATARGSTRWHTWLLPASPLCCPAKKLWGDDAAGTGWGVPGTRTPLPADVRNTLASLSPSKSLARVVVARNLASMAEIASRSWI